MILKHLGHNRSKEHGFTLVELLVAMAITAVVMAAVYTLYKTQQDSYIAQDQVVEMQQNVRASLYQMARDMRMAGFNPQRAPNVGGFVTQLPDDGGGTTTTNSTNIAFTIDQDSNGVIDIDANTEQIAYRLDNATSALQKFRVSDDTWQTVADNISAVDFVYLDLNGTDITASVIANPTAQYATTNLPFIDSIRSIEMSIVARTGRIDTSFPGTPAYLNQQGTEILAVQADHYRKRLITTTIFCRNLGL
ncbi:MAG: prepilin-type N-terminal cleavage/methylation domain-containing protein [Syntrophobacteria bacterium]